MSSQAMNSNGGPTPPKKSAKDRAVELAEQGNLPPDIPHDLVFEVDAAKKPLDDDQITELMDDSTNRALKQQKSNPPNLVWPIWASGAGAMLTALVIMILATIQHQSRTQNRPPEPGALPSTKFPPPGLNVTAILKACSAGKKDFDYDLVSQKVALERLDLLEDMKVTDFPVSITSCSPVNVAALIATDERMRYDLDDEKAFTRYAIASLYLSMGGNDWIHSWGLGFDECSYHGVTCNRDKRHVTGLSLKNNNLQGSIPDAVGRLSKLTSLDLSGNQLEGSIPKSLYDLTLLQSLNVEGNKLTGAIPALGALTSLVQLDLSRNMLRGQVNFLFTSFAEAKSGITFISVQNNKLNGFIPKQIGDLTNLRVLRLNENKISGSLPAELSNLAELETFEAPVNVLTGIIPAGLSPRLKTLLLDDNELSGTLPQDLYNLAELEVLLLGRNQHIRGSISTEVGQLTSLGELALDYCSLTGAIPSEVGKLSKLAMLNLGNNLLEGTIPEELSSLKGLQSEDAGLKVVNAKIVGPVAPKLCGNFTSIEFCAVPKDCQCCTQSNEPVCKEAKKRKQ